MTQRKRTQNFTTISTLVDARETLKYITDIRSKRLNLMDSRPCGGDKILKKCEPKGTAMR